MLPGVTGHHVEVVDTELLVVVGIQLEQRVGVGVGILFVEVATRHVVASRGYRPESGIFVAVGTSHVVTQVQVQAQVFEAVNLIVQLHVTQRTPRVVAVGIVVELRQGVDAVVGTYLTAHVPVPVAVEELFVDAAVGIAEVGFLRRGEGDGAAHGSRVGIVGLVVDTLGVDVHAQVVIEEFGSHAYREVGTLVVAHLQRSLVVGVAHAHPVGELAFHIAIDTQVLVGREGRAIDEVLPVGIGRTHERLYGLQTAGAGIGAAHVVAILVARHHVECRAVLFQTVAGVVAHLHVVAGALLGGDDNHTVRSARTVDGGGRSILQYRIGVDVVGVDRCQRVGHAGTTLGRNGYPVDYDQGVVLGLQRSGATNTNGCTTGGVARSGSNQQARHLALQHLVGRSDGTTVDVLGLDGGNRTGEVGLFHRTVTDYNHLVKQLFILLQNKFHQLAGGLFLRLIANVRDGDDVALVGLDGKVSVDIGTRSVASSLHQDVGSDNSHTRVVQYNTLHCHALCKSMCR